MRNRNFNIKSPNPLFGSFLLTIALALITTDSIYSQNKTILSQTNENGAISISANGIQLLQYNYATVIPPKGTAKRFERGGFIHPIHSPSGQILTRIFPKDHPHHMGIWNPWTHVLYKGDTVDFWNIGDGRGTVRFKSLINTENNSSYSGFESLHEHVSFVGVEEEVVMRETWEVKVWRPVNASSYVIDFISTLNCASDQPVMLLEYRYGGFGFRATEDWGTSNSVILTSEGLDRSNADATKARWCKITGGDTKKSGILFLSHPSNYNHPEPMRIWPSNQYDGKSNVFFSFSPTRDRDWLLEVGKKYSLAYRMIVFDGDLSRDESEEFWKSYAKDIMKQPQTK